MTNLPEFLQSQRTTALATLHPLPETQEQVARFVAMAVEEALDGHTDLMMLRRRLQAALDSITGIMDGVKQAEIEKAGKFVKKGEFSAAGARFLLDQKVTYDYKVCNDPVLIDLEKRLKKRKMFLKNLPSRMFDESTGGVEINPPLMKITPYLSVKKY